MKHLIIYTVLKQHYLFILATHWCTIQELYYGTGVELYDSMVWSSSFTIIIIKLPYLASTGTCTGTWWYINETPDNY